MHLVASLVTYVPLLAVKAKDVQKTVVKTKDSFLEGLKSGNADAWSIVLIVGIVVIGGGLAAWYFRNR